MPDSNPEVNTLCDGDPLARSLAALRPAPAGLDPTHVVFLAGQDAAARRVTFWQRAAVVQGLLVAALVGFALLQFNRTSELEGQAKELEGQVAELRARPPAPPAPAPEPAPPVEPEAAPMPREAPPAEPYHPGQAGFIARTADEPTPEERAKWLRLRNDVLAAGIGVLPTPARPDPTPPADWDGSIELPRVYAIPPAPKPMPKPDLPPD